MHIFADPALMAAQQAALLAQAQAQAQQAQAVQQLAAAQQMQALRQQHSAVAANQSTQQNPTVSSQGGAVVAGQSVSSTQQHTTNHYTASVAQQQDQQQQAMAAQFAHMAAQHQQAQQQMAALQAATEPYLAHTLTPAVPGSYVSANDYSMLIAHLHCSSWPCNNVLSTDLPPTDRASRCLQRESPCICHHSPTAHSVCRLIYNTVIIIMIVSITMLLFNESNHRTHPRPGPVCNVRRRRRRLPLYNPYHSPIPCAF
jgi:hypothetical protein